jgi:hypothetical protein
MSAMDNDETMNVRRCCCYPYIVDIVPKQCAPTDESPIGSDRCSVLALGLVHRRLGGLFHFCA